MSSGVAASTSIEDQGIEDHREREKLKQVERPSHARIGLQELPDEALRRVEEDEEIESAGPRPGGAAGERGEVESEEEGHRQAFVELDRMAGDAVGEIDAPGQRGRNP